MTAHCHKLVAKVAKEATGELYEVVMGDNLVFAEWKRQNPGLNAKQLERKFVARNWGKCLEFARATLARLLTTPIDARVKEEIMDALVKDATLMRGRAPMHHFIHQAPKAEQ